MPAFALKCSSYRHNSVVYMDPLDMKMILGPPQRFFWPGGSDVLLRTQTGNWFYQASRRRTRSRPNYARLHRCQRRPFNCMCTCWHLSTPAHSQNRARPTPRGCTQSQWERRGIGQGWRGA
ncbi:hypothetical protein BD413DRAFT_310338 [Trametes elegans]|nr:hypothetical protein BD413DRAFT_310338 [Trametes elegans]